MMKTVVRLTLLLLLITAANMRAGNAMLYTSGRLTSSTVNCVRQDAYGYIWICTDYGLNRFDGYRFTAYNHNSADTTSVISNEVTTVFKDSRSRLWVGFDIGLMRFDYEHNRFIRYRFPGNRLPRVKSIIELRDGSLVIATSGYGLYTIQAGSNSITRDELLQQASSEDFANIIYEDSRGALWKCSHLPRAARITKVGNRPSTHNYSLSAGPAVAVLPSGNKGVLIVCMYGILRYDYASGTMTDAGYDISALGGSVSINSATQDNQGNILIGTSGKGLMRIPAGSHKLCKVDESTPDFDLGTANINDVFEDKDANFWISCNKKGLFRFSGGYSAFKGTTFTEQRHYLGSCVSSITPGRNGDVYVTVQKSGVYSFDRTGHINGHPEAPSGPNLIYRDSRGDYWLCTENSLYSYNPTNGTATHIDTYSGWGLNKMTDDGRGTYYISNYGRGMVVYDKNTGRSETISMRDVKRRGGTILNDWVKALHIDRNGILWIATVDGVSCMDTKTRSFKNVPYRNILHAVPCFSFAETRAGQMLIGTNSGLYAYDMKHKRLFRPEGTQNLRNKAVYSIVEDRRGDLWMSSPVGIWQYDRRGHRLIGHVSGNGLVDKEYILGAALHAADDRITFATNDGITSFYPQEVRSARTKMDSVYLTAMLVDGQWRDCRLDRYTLSHDENTIQLEYSLLNYRHADEITFQYRINNTGRWISLAEGTNTVLLSKLKPGTYWVQVRAVSNGIVSDHVKAITITVRSPWYASAPAFLIYVFILAVISYMGFSHYERRRKNELQEAKMRFLINATHDIRSPLTLIVEPLKRLREHLQDAESKSYIDTIDRNAQKLLLLVNSILDQRRIDKNQMRLHCQATSLAEYLSASCAMFRYNARQHNVALRVVASENMPEAWIDRINFDKVMQNLLSNAFKFTPDGGEIIVSTECDGKNFIIDVTDTGCGFGENDTDKLFDRFYQGLTRGGTRSEGTGIGLNLSRTLVLMHGGTIKAFNRKDGKTGAVIQITIPVGNTHLKPEEIITEPVEDTPQIDTPRRQASKNCRIMIVDDDAELAEYICNELSDWYKVDVRNNGREALDALLKGGYDLVISDVMMPVMDGITLLKNIKSNNLISDIPVILLTSKADVADRLDGIRRGADAYIAKPFDMNEVRAVADNLISNVRRLRGKFTGAQSQADKVEQVQIKGNNDTLMDRIMKSLNDNMSDPDFNVEKLSADIGVSRAQLHRKMKEITGISTGEFIRNLKLEQAARLIRKGDVNITQVAYAVGFNNSTHFSTVFKKHFGMSPSEYAEKHSDENEV